MLRWLLSALWYGTTAKPFRNDARDCGSTLDHDHVPLTLYQVQRCVRYSTGRPRHRAHTEKLVILPTDYQGFCLNARKPISALEGKFQQSVQVSNNRLGVSHSVR